METQILITQFFLLLPIFITVFLIKWGFIQWIIQKALSLSFWITLALGVGSLAASALFYLLFKIYTPDSQEFVAMFSMGIKGFLNLFFLMFAIWGLSFILDLLIMSGLHKYIQPTPDRLRVVIGLLWANFFSSPLLTFIIWLLQFET